MTVFLSGTPVLQTERLTLRAPKGSDWRAFAAFAGSDRARFIGGPYDRKAAWRAFGHVIGHWAMRGYGSFVFTLRGADAPVGMTGPWHPEGWPEREIGWTVWSPEAEGKGYAFEAARAALSFAFETLGWDTAVSYIDEGNDRSIALARRLGAVADESAAKPDKEWPPIHVFRHARPEARA